MSFKNQQALVTGGTSGIGLAVTRALVEQGCRVIATGLHSHEVNEFALTAEFATAVQLDVTDDKAIVGLITSLDRLDILINCAGTIFREGGEFTGHGFARVVDVNLNGTMRVCYGCRPMLKASKGSIVNIGSLYSWFGAKHVPAYSASKGGVIELTKSLAIAWAEDGIRVNAVQPGWIETPFTEAVQSNADWNRVIIERTPLKRWGTPDEVARAVLFLASGQASFITGTVLAVDGGYSAV